MKISFDFDNTLSVPWVQEIAKALIRQGHEVWVTTSRRECDSSEVHAVCKTVGILLERCQFTHFEDKVHFLKDFDVHFDDDDYEIDLINRDEGKCKGVLLGFINWRADVAKMMQND